jgi:hypothetical protein
MIPPLMSLGQNILMSCVCGLTVNTKYWVECRKGRPSLRYALPALCVEDSHGEVAQIGNSYTLLCPLPMHSNVTKLVQRSDPRTSVHLLHRIISLKHPLVAILA